MTMDASGEGFDHVTYRHQVIPLSRMYADFHDYRDDPNNLPESVRPKVVDLVRNAAVEKSYPSRKAVQDALMKLMFPGYGLSMLGLNEPVALFSLEVPYAAEQRLILFTQSDGVWKAADDFLWPDGNGYIERGAYDGDVFLYYNRVGAVVRNHSKALRDDSRK